MLLTFVGAIPLLIWIYLLTARGGFWRISKHLRQLPVDRVPAKRVVAIIPARNEAAVIGEAVEALLAQELPVPLHVVVVDDGSTDDTAEIARRTAGVKIIKGQPLATGWTGKLWALSQGTAYAESLAPDYFLFTDADIVHGPAIVGQLLTVAEFEQRDLASYMVKLACASTAERALIPAFVFFFLKLYPPAWIASNKRRTAGAAGGCILIRASALQKIGGVEQIKNEIIDDCALARVVKNGGGRIWMGLTAEAESIRSYESFAEIGRMISRTAFNQLHHSYALLTATIFGLFLTYLIPVVLLFTGKPVAMALGASAWLAMSICYLPTVRFYKKNAVWAVTLPAIALFYMAATVHSAIQYVRGRGGTWKGRVQDVQI